MDAARCSEARAQYAEATARLESNTNILSGAVAAQALALASRAALSLSQSDVEAIGARLQQARDAMLVTRGGDDVGALAENVARLEGQLAKAKEEAEARRQLEAQLADLDAKIRDANYQIEVQTSRASAAKTEMDLYCQ
ncbi:MAG TPA: hypothetical protein VF704_12575 [Allosphingosinicella sp.]|jgi:chromosome segregation ATPase